MDAIRYAENLAELASRGAPVASDSRILAVRCVDCSAQYLYDERHEMLFLDPKEPASVFDDEGEPPACRQCGRADWQFEDLEGDEAVSDGPWHWAFWQPPPPRTRSLPVKILIFAFLILLAVIGVVSLALNPDPLATPEQTRPNIHDYGL